MNANVFQSGLAPGGPTTAAPATSPASTFVAASLQPSGKTSPLLQAVSAMPWHVCPNLFPLSLSLLLQHAPLQPLLYSLFSSSCFFRQPSHCSPRNLISLSFSLNLNFLTCIVVLFFPPLSTFFSPSLHPALLLVPLQLGQSTQSYHHVDPPVSPVPGQGSKGFSLLQNRMAATNPPMLPPKFDQVH